MNSDNFSKYDFPIGRIGNIKNPKLIILLENQNSHPSHYTINPEYIMKVLGEFEPKEKYNYNESLKLETVVKYDRWWFELSQICEQFKSLVNNEEVLALEYYPFATDNSSKEKEIYESKWEDDSYAKKSLEVNKMLLKNALNYNVPIFVYYKSGWYGGRDKYDIDPILVKGQSNFISDYEPNRAVPSAIRNRLIKFLSQPFIKNQIIKLRENSGYSL